MFYVKLIKKLILFFLSTPQWWVRVKRTETNIDKGQNWKLRANLLFEYLQFKNYETKIKSPFLIQADFKSILDPENNEKPNPNQSYPNIYQNYVTCSFEYKLVCANCILKKVNKLKMN